MLNKGTVYQLVSSENMSQTRGEEVKKNRRAESGSILQDHFHIPSSLPGYRRCSSSVFFTTQTQKYNPDLRFRCLISSCFKVSILPLAMAEVKMYLKLFHCFEFTLSQDLSHCVPCNTFGEQREIYEWIRLFREVLFLCQGGAYFWSGGRSFHFRGALFGP